jgi:hypothetical protein
VRHPDLYGSRGESCRGRGPERSTRTVALPAVRFLLPACIFPPPCVLCFAVRFVPAMRRAWHLRGERVFRAKPLGKVSAAMNSRSCSLSFGGRFRPAGPLIVMRGCRQQQQQNAGRKNAFSAELAHARPPFRPHLGSLPALVVPSPVVSPRAHPPATPNPSPFLSGRCSRGLATALQLTIGGLARSSLR